MVGVRGCSGGLGEALLPQGQASDRLGAEVVRVALAVDATHPEGHHEGVGRHERVRAAAVQGTALQLLGAVPVLEVLGVLDVEPVDVARDDLDKVAAAILLNQWFDDAFK